jgi:hypothetical protein
LFGRKESDAWDNFCNVVVDDPLRLWDCMDCRMVSPNSTRGRCGTY